MSRRDRATLALGILVAIGLVAYPLAYRLIKGANEGGTALSSVSAEPTPTPSPTPARSIAPSPPPASEPALIDTSWLQTAWSIVTRPASRSRTRARRAARRADLGHGRLHG